MHKYRLLNITLNTVVRSDLGDPADLSFDEVERLARKMAAKCPEIIYVVVQLQLVAVPPESVIRLMPYE